MSDAGFHPLVANVRDAGGYDHYVGRDPAYGDVSLGNPFRVGRDGTLGEVVARYEAYLRSRPRLMALARSLRGKRLGCHCRGKLPDCHANVVARIANEELVEQPRRSRKGSR